MTTALVALGTQLCQRFGLDAAAADVLDSLKQTAFRSKDGVTDAQLTALMVVANQYGLNPFTKELYAFPSERGIVPMVSVDGWIRIVNEHPMFDGVEFDYDPEFVTCRMYRKDRTRPTEITEYLVECKRGTDPWRNMPRRMMRNKAFIQCARVAFGFAFFDDEEGAQAAGVTLDAETGEILPPAPAPGPKRRSEAKPAAEDATPAATPSAPAQKGGTAATSAPAPAGSISGNQVAYLRNKLKAAGVEEQTILDRFQVAGLEHLSSEQFDLVKSELLAAV